MIYQITLSVNQKKTLNSHLWPIIKADLKHLFYHGEKTGVLASNNEQSLNDISIISTKDSNSTQYPITPSFEFANNLEYTSTDSRYIIYILASILIVDRQARDLISVTTNISNDDVSRAITLIKESTNLVIPHNRIDAIIFKRRKGRPISGNEKLSTQARSAKARAKKHNRQKVSLNSWLPKEHKESLLEYCKENNLTIESALAKIIPIGISIARHINKTED